ncbi:Uncharacterized membrane protein YoaT, DUF817 family [Lishizhenia tianjinensis]|uniref:Uncharacterized membrane protein YoaT, DUF817 family n=1 Tax=Lishizhenia tianjinensis TaxID=477690 RepID=A0A1I6YZE0_9FLAO|nr:DUF817 domain-containing protein [Lishizhenia tianjinensis]SFT55803.1 Uncharacterized membrane protein YoaT, DUF817 family [Lishizhenia tianjinensis]
MKRLHQHILSALYLQEGHSKTKAFLSELTVFTYKNMLSCIFPAYIFLVLALSNMLGLNFMHRYDFLFVACVLAQVALLLTGIESKREVLVIMGFHFLGIIMEVHKVNVGSWSYPEDALFKFWGVPLYSGFMYSSVGSYVCRAWDNFSLKITDWPKNRYAIPVGFAIYLNFFTNAFIQDLRWYIVLLLLIVFRKTKVHFTTNGRQRYMPLLLSFVLIGFFLWLAENIATYLGAWQYTYQHKGWQMVDLGKLSSWSLLVIVSIIIVVQLKRFFSKDVHKEGEFLEHH